MRVASLGSMLEKAFVRPFSCRFSLVDPIARCRISREGVARAVAAWAPQAAIDCLDKSTGGLGERGGVVFGHKAADGVVGEVGTVKRIEMCVVDGPRRGSEREEVIDGRRDLGRTLVTVSHDAGNPAGVGRAGADNPPQLLAQ